MCGSLMKPFQPATVRGFSKYTRITTNSVSRTRSARRARRPAYSSAAAGSWIEHGPITTKRRGSLRSRIARTVARPRATVSAAAGASGTSAWTASGVGMSSMPATLTLSSCSVFMSLSSPGTAIMRSAAVESTAFPGTVMTDLSALDLDAYWMPLTPNRAFKRSPRLVVGAKDMYYTTADGKQVLDGLATLWCVNAGHCRPKIVAAIGRQAGVLDYASSYSLGHPLAFEAAHRLVALAPEGIGHAFFTNSGSEAVETALKIALAYHRLRGEATRTRFVGRERAFHGANFGGISVGGVPAYRKAFAAGLLPGVDHLRHTQDLETRAFVRGEAATGVELADELENRIIPLHDASNIAAVIVEPVAGAGGVLVPAARIPEAAARDLRPARDPPHLRRGDHRVRAARKAVREPVLRRHARSHHVRERHHQRHRADGRRPRKQGDLPHVHGRIGRRGRALPRLHLLRTSARGGGCARDAGHLRRGAALRPAERAGEASSRTPCTRSAGCRTSSTAATSS